MARVHGKKGQISMDPAGGSTYVALADISAFTLNMAKDRVDVTAMQDTNKQKVLGLPDFSGTISGWWNSANTPTIFDAVLGDIAVGLKLVPNTLEATFFFSGLAYLDGNLNVDGNGAVSFGSAFDAAGNWTMAP